MLDAARHRLRFTLLVLLAALACACTSDPQLPGQQLRQVLAPGGKLRVGLYPGTPTSIIVDSGTAAARGVGHDLGRALAQRLGVEFEPVVFAKNLDVLEALKAGRVDVAFTNASAERAKEMDFTAPYLEIELGFLVPRASPIAALDEVDRPGTRVGVTARSSSDATLSRDLRQARVVRAATVKAGVEMLANNQLDAYATNKSTLFEMAAELPGARVLDGRWGVERHALALPKGRDAGLPFARSFVEAAKTEGLVRAAVARAGLRGAIDAP